jgi:DNA modification methylase
MADNPQPWPADRVERRPLAALVPYARNARTHSDEQIAQIAASIREWGFTVPVLVDEGGTIIAGHGRVLAASRLGLGEVPVMVARGWSEAQKRAYAIADNKLTENGGWDDALLKIEFADLESLGFDLPLMGFSEADLADLTNSNGEASELPHNVDDIPDKPEHPITRPGDVWQLGRHRLICGDCRDPSIVARAVDGVMINLAFTSPPYAVQRSYDVDSGFRPIKPDDYVEWFAPVAANVANHLVDDGSWFINIKPSADGMDTELYVFDLVLAHVRQWGWHFATEFCWERNGVPKGVTQRFKNQFEPVYQFARNRWKMRPDTVRHQSDNVPTAGGPGSGNTSGADFQGGSREEGIGGTFGAVKKRRNGTSVTMSRLQGENVGPGEYIGPGLAYPGNRLPTFATTHEATGHTAAFPVGLPRFFCLAYTDADDVVFDPFVGSGSTLIAAAHSNRTGVGCELSPAYCDITIARYRKQFADDRVMLADDGRSFDEIAVERGIHENRTPADADPSALAAG